MVDEFTRAIRLGHVVVAARRDSSLERLDRLLCRHKDNRAAIDGRQESNPLAHRNSAEPRHSDVKHDALRVHALEGCDSSQAIICNNDAISCFV